MTDIRNKNAQWRLNVDANGVCYTPDAQLAVLMDIRDELQGIRRRLDCSETLSIPSLLNDIKKNTASAAGRRGPDERSK